MNVYGFYIESGNSKTRLILELKSNHHLKREMEIQFRYKLGICIVGRAQVTVLRARQQATVEYKGVWWI